MEIKNISGKDALEVLGFVPVFSFYIVITCTSCFSNESMKTVLSISVHGDSMARLSNIYFPILKVLPIRMWIWSLLL